MAEVGTYYITIMPEMSKFTGSVNKAMGDLGGTSGKTFNGSFLDVVKGSAIGTALGGVASKLGSTFMSGISTGISRLDTLNNFPRVMESFGYSADEASDAVNNIMVSQFQVPHTKSANSEDGGIKDDNEGTPDNKKTEEFINIPDNVSDDGMPFN